MKKENESVLKQMSGSIKEREEFVRGRSHVSAMKQVLFHGRADLGEPATGCGRRPASVAEGRAGGGALGVPAGPGTLSPQRELPSQPGGQAEVPSLGAWWAVRGSPIV